MSTRSPLRARRLARRLAGAALVALALPLAGACDDFIQPKPRGILAPETFYRTGADAVAAVNGVYEQVKWTYFFGYWFVSDIPTDDVMPSASVGADVQRLARYNFDANEWFFRDNWSNSYRTINRANAVLGRVPAVSMDATLKARVLAEARFLRAFAYFNLVRWHGDVPLLDREVTSLRELQVGRSPAEQVYQLIIADLQAAIPALPASYSGADVGRATSRAARALLAKVHLTRREWADAARLAGQVMTAAEPPAAALNANWKDNFRIAVENVNPESLFEVNFDGVLDPGAGSVFTLATLPGGFPGGDAWGDLGLMPSLPAIWAPDDQRGYGASYITPGYVDARGRTVTWGSGIPYSLKWLDQTSAQNMESRAWVAQPNNFVVLRYADVLLMYAEAVNEGGAATAGSAEAALNAVRARAGLAPVGGLSQAAFRDSVRLERRREFVLEGQRWFDLKRWGALDAAIRAKTAEMAARDDGATAVHGVPNDLLPIPQAELDANPLITQNPGWGRGS